MRKRVSRGGWLDVGDLVRLFGCSPATVYRCVWGERWWARSSGRDGLRS